jgi:hypothetical protein
VQVLTVTVLSASLTAGSTLKVLLAALPSFTNSLMSFIVRFVYESESRQTEIVETEFQNDYLTLRQPN